MNIRAAKIGDCPDIAQLALMAGEGIPAYFWESLKKPGETIEQVGARQAQSETNNFSYLNTCLSIKGDQVMGMLLAYRLPAVEQTENLMDYPEFMRPLIELEHCVPESFYINMLATYPAYRKQGVGEELLLKAKELAQVESCEIISIEVFEQNQSALRLYQKMGYQVIERRRAIPHECHPYSGDILLMTLPI